MPAEESTCWTVIRGAAQGNVGDREELARRYLPVVRSYLAVRWRNSPLLQKLEDTVQEIFVECFRAGGAPVRADRERVFRPFLYAVVRNVARRAERGSGVGREQVDPDLLCGREEPPDRAFDRAWARSLLREAAAVQEQASRGRGSEALRRVELLRLRFHEGLAIREIAARWAVDPAVLHHEYAKARQEFRAALEEVVAFHEPGSPGEIEQACVDLLALLGS